MNDKHYDYYRTHDKHYDYYSTSEMYLEKWNIIGDNYFGIILDNVANQICSVGPTSGRSLFLTPLHWRVFKIQMNKTNQAMKRHHAFKISLEPKGL